MNLKLLKIALLLWGASLSSLPAIGQPLSFEIEELRAPWYSRLEKVLETPDTGFLVLFSHRFMKIDKRGEIEWSRFAYEISASIGSHPAHYSIFDFDSSYIYLRGIAYRSSYYSLLNHQGETLFDTIYLHSWRYEEDPFSALGYTDVIGDDMLSFTVVYTNIMFDSQTFEHDYDNACLSFQKVNKFNGERRDMRVVCLSDSNQNLANVIKLNTQDKGYLLNVEYYDRNSFVFTPHNLLLRLDSSGNILSIKDMFPRDIFPMQNDQRIRRIGPVYDPELFEGKYFPSRHSFDSAAIGFYVICEIGNVGTSEYIVLFDTNGHVVHWRERDRRNNQVKSKIQSLSDTFVFYDEIGNVVWKRKFDTRRDEFPYANFGGRFRTSYEGILRITHTDASSSSASNFLIQHIGPHGLPFGYDPDAPIPPPWNEADSLNIFAWFDRQGNLVVPKEVNTWPIVISNTVGQEVFNTQGTEEGKLPLHNKVSPGIYFIRFQSPHSGKVYFAKVMKQN